MRLPETRDLFIRELEFPASCETVIELIGEQELEAPNGDDESIEAILGRSGVEQFTHADELYDTLLTCVGDAFIGRKYYDDRSGISSNTDDDEIVHF